MSTDRQLAIDHNRAQDRLSAAWNDGSPTDDLDAAARAWERAYAADVWRPGAEAYDARSAAEDVSDMLHAFGLHGAASRVGVSDRCPLVSSGLSNPAYADTQSLPAEIIERLGRGDEGMLLCLLVGCVALRRYEAVEIPAAYWRHTRAVRWGAEGEVNRSRGDASGALRRLEDGLGRGRAAVRRELGYLDDE